MNRIKNYIAIGAFALLVLALPAIASAQYRNDDYYGNGRYGNNGYGNIRGTIQSLKNQARDFERRADRVDDRSDDRYGNDRYNDRRYRGNNRYGNLEQLAERFRNATDDLAGAYGRGRNLNNSADEARRVLDIGSQIDQEIARSRGARNVENQWRQIRRDLQIVARAYNLNYSGRGGNWRDRVPFPLPF